MTSAEDRIADIIDEHHQADEYGYDTEDCRCGDYRDGTETWAKHLARVLVSELGLCEVKSSGYVDSLGFLSLDYVQYISRWDPA